MRRRGPAALAWGVALLLGAAQAAAAQAAAPAESLRRLFATSDFAPARFGPARWVEGGAYTTVERSAAVEGGSDIVRYAAATGERSVLVSAARLVPAGAATPLEIDDYAWSPEGDRLLIFTDSRRVWRSNTRGDYWVLDLATGALRQLGGADAPESSLMFATFSPRGDQVAYVREGDLYVERLADGRITRLTRDGSRTVVNGTSDWVYEEEFGLRHGFRWSPDGTKIAFWHFDMSGVRDFLLVNNTDSLYSFTIPIQYPKAGETNSAVTAGVVSAEGGPVTWLRLPGDTRDDYLPWMEWADDSRELLLQRVNRRQNNDGVMLADATTGAVRPVLTERDSAWVDVVGEVPWLDGGKAFLWTSERDGWRHLYRVSRDGGSAQLLTPGDYDVIGVEAIDRRGGWIYLTASPGNATQRYLYRVPLRGGAPERVTPADQPGTHGYQISPDARWALHTLSTFDTPPVTEVVRLPDHSSVRTLVDNARLRTEAAALIPRPTEFFRVELADGTELDGWMIFPRDFDPSKRYPLVMQVYSEPASQTVLDRWGGSTMLWHHLIADQGYIVASVDNRGTPAPRGRAWRKVVYGAVGALSSAEQADAVRQLTRSRAYLDPARVGIWGWSGGGSATLNALFRYPDVYRVGMSVAPVADQRLYDSVYQERYMGLPRENPEGYRLGSPIHFAEGLEGDLLLVHGSGDDNVHYQGTERLANRLVELGKPFQFMVYPNRSHCICEGQGTSLHLFSLLTDYLTTHLPGGGRPQEAPLATLGEAR